MRLSVLAVFFAFALLLVAFIPPIEPGWFAGAILAAVIAVLYWRDGL